MVGSKELFNWLFSAFIILYIAALLLPIPKDNKTVRKFLNAFFLFLIIMIVAVMLFVRRFATSRHSYSAGTWLNVKPAVSFFLKERDALYWESGNIVIPGREEKEEADTYLMRLEDDHLDLAKRYYLNEEEGEWGSDKEFARFPEDISTVMVSGSHFRF